MSDDARTPADPSPEKRPAEVLIGVELDEGWVVTEGMPLADHATGSTFSVPYIVEREVHGEPERAFMKALDLAKLTTIGHDVARALALGTVSYEHEKAIVLRCGSRRMSNVVRGISAGETVAPAGRFDPMFGVLSAVPYLIFECADGDIRKAIESNGNAFDEAWSLNVMHGISKGIGQLHAMSISHQDVKPSNIMTFGDDAKVGDLGRASDGVDGSLWSGAGINGDSTYAPLELLYNHPQTDDRVRRWACDMYHVGSMVVFLATGSGLTALIFKELDPTFHHRVWPNSYRNVLPYVRDAYDRALLGIADRIREPLRGDLMKVIREMCDPDPALRGSPRLEGLPRYAIGRYTSLFDRLSKQADLHLARVLS
ncbi:MAG: hypothetical protein JNK12_09000 [Acidimicrobiales bacterium]|nr:hypothetical protein [Acidimicrobiales bacterium]